MHKLGKSVQARYLELLGENPEFPEGGYEGEYIIEIAKKLVTKTGNSLKESTDIGPFTKVAESTILHEIKKTLNRIGLKFDNFFNENFLYESGMIDNVVNACV